MQYYIFILAFLSNIHSVLCRWLSVHKYTLSESKVNANEKLYNSIVRNDYYFYVVFLLKF